MAVPAMGREATEQVSGDIRRLRSSLSRSLMSDIQRERLKNENTGTVFTRYGADHHEWLGYFCNLLTRQLFYAIAVGIVIWMFRENHGGPGFEIYDISGDSLTRWLIVASTIATWLLSGRKRLRRWGWFITSPILLAGLAVLHVVFFR